MDHLDQRHIMLSSGTLIIQKIWRRIAEAAILWPPAVKSRLIGKDPGAGKDCEQKEKWVTEDEMAGWHR